MDHLIIQKKSKSDQERFNDLVEQIKTYGWPDFQYLQYGMDVKTPEECAKYVNAMELDSIAHAVNAFIEKYEPVTVESKSYNNSSFFRANNVDSVEVKVFGNK